MRRRSTLVPTPSLTNRAALPPHKKASQAQLARRKIRKWAQFLPEDEAVTFRAQLNQTEKELRRKKKEELQHQYTWSNVPGEVRNMIYEYLMVQESPIAPVVEKKLIRKHDLGANFLLSGKAVLNEALPVLFGANTFEVNVHFHHILGDSRVGRLARGKLFKKVLINNAAVTGESRSFNKLTNLDTCIIVERGWPNAHSHDMDFDSAAFSAFEQRSALAVRKFISRNPDTKFYFLYDVEHRIFPQPSTFKSTAVGVCLRVRYARLDQSGYIKFTYEHLATDYYKELNAGDRRETQNLSDSPYYQYLKEAKKVPI